jgi:uncharacterized iron-regulated membrane protein
MNEPAPTRRPPTERRKHKLTRGAFYAHLWLGVVFTIVLTAISITGVLLNHKRGLGLMPEVTHAPAGAFATALPLSRLATIALAAVPPGDSLDVAFVDRMDVRPGDGFVKVRLRDAASTEVTVDLTTGRILHIGPRGDVFLEKLHSGEIFGGRGVLLSDAGAIALVITLITGVWLWLVPKLRRGGRDGAGDSA